MPSDYLFDAASAKGIPVLLSRTDTENTVIALEGIFDNTRFQGERKLDRMAALLEGPLFTKRSRSSSMRLRTLAHRFLIPGKPRYRPDDQRRVPHGVSRSPRNRAFVRSARDVAQAPHCRCNAFASRHCARASDVAHPALLRLAQGLGYVRELQSEEIVRLRARDRL